MALATHEQIQKGKKKKAEQQDIMKKLESEYQRVKGFCRDKMREYPQLSTAIKPFLLDLDHVLAVAKGETLLTSSSASGASQATSIKIDGREFPLNLSREAFVEAMAGYYWSKDSRVRSEHDDSLSAEHSDHPSWDGSFNVPPHPHKKTIQVSGRSGKNVKTKP